MTGETVATVRDQDGTYLGAVVYWSAGTGTRWDFSRAGGHVIATAHAAGWGYTLAGAATGGYPSLTVAAQDVYGKRVRVLFSTPPD